MKKFLAALLASMMVASVVVGCNNNQTPSEEPSSDAPSSEEPSSEEPSSEEEVSLSGELKVAALESAYGADMWQQVADAFTAIYPDVTVTLTVDPNIEDLLDPQFQAGQYPDVVHCSTGREGGFVEEIRDNNGLRDLTTMLATTIPGEDVTPADKIIGGFTDTAVTNPYSDGKTYMAPMFYSPCGLFYNANLLEDNGWTFPTTWDEMWELGDKAKEKGISLFTYPTSGYFDAFMSALIASEGGADMFNKAMKYEGWDSDEMKAVLDTVAKLGSYTEPTTVGNATDTGFTKNQQLVIDGKAICMPNGTWIIGEMADSTPEDFKWGFSAVPAVNPDNAPVSFCWIEQMWSPAEAPNPELADAFMAFCYSDAAADIFAASGAIQPITGIADSLEGDNKLFYSVYDNGAESIMGDFAATNPVDGVDIKTSVYTNMDKIVGGSLTVEDWQAEIVAACEQLKPEII